MKRVVAFLLAVITLFAVAVFDEKICENFKYDENDRSAHGDFTLKNYLDKRKPGFSLNVTNLVNSSKNLYSSSIELSYVARGYDIMWYYTQVFDRSKGTWDSVNEDVVGCETQAVI